MHAVRVTSTNATRDRLLAKARHAEPQLHSRRREDREAANKRIKQCEQEIADCVYGHDPHYGVIL